MPVPNLLKLCAHHLLQLFHAFMTRPQQTEHDAKDICNIFQHVAMSNFIRCCAECIIPNPTWTCEITCHPAKTACHPAWLSGSVGTFPWCSWRSSWRFQLPQKPNPDEHPKKYAVHDLEPWQLIYHIDDAFNSTSICVFIVYRKIYKQHITTVQINSCINWWLGWVNMTR